MGTGLSKKTNLQGDVARKAAVKLGNAPFSKTFANSRPSAKSGGATNASPAGKLSPKKLAGVGRGK